jgi:hypothetical protein
MVQPALESLYVLLVQFNAVTQQVVELPDIILHLLRELVKWLAHLVVLEDDNSLLLPYAEFEFLGNVHLLLEGQDGFS